MMKLNDKEDIDSVKLSEMEVGDTIVDLEMNVSNTMLVACGLSGEFHIYDITDVSNVQETFNDKIEQTTIVSANWNKRVAHILVLTLATGVVVVFDSKKKKNVMKFGGDNIKWKNALWVPTEKTFMITISDDSNGNQVVLWDVRNINAPAKIFEGHKEGVVSICWCQTDDNVFATSGHDKTMIWDYKNAKTICEFKSEPNCYDTIVSWSALEGRFCTESLDGKTKFFTISDYGNDKHPKWMERCAGIAFGFGGKRIEFNKVQLILKKIQSNIEIKKMEKGEIEEYCEEKGNSTEGEEQQSWKLINSMVCGEKDVINKIVEFDKENVDKELNEYYEKNNLNEKKEVKEIEEEDDDDVFDKIGEENEKKELIEKKEFIEETEEDKLFAELFQLIIKKKL